MGEALLEGCCFGLHELQAMGGCLFPCPGLPKDFWSLRVIHKANHWKQTVQLGSHPGVSKANGVLDTGSCFINPEGHQGGSFECLGIHMDGSEPSPKSVPGLPHPSLMAALHVSTQEEGAGLVGWPGGGGGTRCCNTFSKNTA